MLIGLSSIPILLIVPLTDDLCSSVGLSSVAAAGECLGVMRAKR
jgi:hypothetical protein